MLDTTYASKLSTWIDQEKAAFELNHIIGKLCFDRSIELVFFRRQLVDVSAREITGYHHTVREVIQQDLTIDHTLAIAKAIAESDIAPSKIDIGKLASEWLKEKSQYSSETDFIHHKLADFFGKDKTVLKPKDVVLFGFGRIGRLAAREIINQAGKGEQLRLRAIVTRENTADDIIKRASLLRRDSVHGSFKGTVIPDLENKTIIVNGHVVNMIASNDPSTIDYKSYGIENALLIDNTGAFRDREGLSKHLETNGITQVLLTAPGKGDIPNIVHGINHRNFDLDKEKIFSAASCTTNAISPVIQVIDREYGIEHGHIETVHAYTNDQNLLDNFHKKARRGRAASINMVITETGAAKAVAKVLPHMAGKLTGNAVRVPTPDVSLAILNLKLKNEASKEEVNEALRQESLHGELVEQIQFSVSEETVSSDLIGNPHASIVDGPSTIVAPGNKDIVLYVWYDNEFGYTRQVFRLAKYIAKVRRKVYY